jgi:hypothetical protein
MDGTKRNETGGFFESRGREKDAKEVRLCVRLVDRSVGRSRPEEG